MEWVFLIVLIGALAYAGVEAMKHFLPSWYDKNLAEANQYFHDRLSALEKKLNGGAND